MKRKSIKDPVPRRQSLFWDVDPNTIDPDKHARYIIERIMDFGTAQEIRWLFSNYPKTKIREALDLPRSVIQTKSRALWELMLK